MNTGKTFTNITVCLSFWIGIVLILLAVNGNFDKKATATPIAADSTMKEPLFLNRDIEEQALLAEKATADIPDDPLPPIEISGKIKAGESFDQAMKRLEVPDHVRFEIIKGFDKSLDFRMLQPGDRFVITLTGDNSIHQAVYQSGRLRSYILKYNDEGFLEAARQEILLEYRVEKLSGIIDSSLYAAFSELREEPKLIHAYADIFASKIDFNTETRKGDRFELLVEKYYKDEQFVGYGRILTARYQQRDEEYLGYYYASEKTPGGYFDQKGEALGTWFIRSPIPFGRVTSRFTMQRKHPIDGVVRPHLGIDLAAPIGTPVMATADGKVEFIGNKGGFGKTVIIRHNGGYKTYYGHLSRYRKDLHFGNSVRQKDIIGYVGSTGKSTGPHLDYRIQHNGIFRNPFGIKFKAKIVLQEEELAAFLLESRRVAALFQTDGAEKILQVKNVILSDDQAISFL